MRVKGKIHQKVKIQMGTKGIDADAETLSEKFPGVYNNYIKLE